MDCQNLYEIANELELYDWIDKRKDERGRRISFGKRVLGQLAGRVVSVGLSRYRIVMDGVGKKRQAKLEII